MIPNQQIDSTASGEAAARESFSGVDGKGQRVVVARIGGPSADGVLAEFDAENGWLILKRGSKGAEVIVFIHAVQTIQLHKNSNIHSH
jgi:hypothetical protein